MGKKRLEIKPIEDKAKRNTAFTKRRNGLCRKAENLCDLCGGEVAVIVFSNAGNLFAYSNTLVDQVVECYLQADHASGMATGSAEQFGTSRVEKEEKLPEKICNIISKAMADERPAWGKMIENLEFEDLENLEAAMKALKNGIAAKEAPMATGDEKEVQS
ncbi:MADS-box transcription factor 3-like [Andrographis paniculata]|uniref:MADS-box transcription factor 3-like n=1 Tax=Andrographis paniculata TaxID=175694 RepID=UPI0021E6ED16|nr:MADS-box transcription factor 3-like [Andrographis paniculata]